LKQVMQDIDSSFDEKNLGMSKFSRFAMEAAQKGLLWVSKLENGQLEVDVPRARVAPAATPATEAAAEPRIERGPRPDVDEDRRPRRGRGRGRERDRERGRDLSLQDGDGTPGALSPVGDASLPQVPMTHDDIEIALGDIAARSSARPARARRTVRRDATARTGRRARARRRSACPASGSRATRRSTSCGAPWRRARGARRACGRARCACVRSSCSAATARA
jgi:hypothetical protein